MADAIESSRVKEEQLPPNENKTMILKPRRECLLKNIENHPDSEPEESEFSDTSHNGNYVRNISVYSDLEDSGGELPSTLEAVTFTELKTASYYEVEDWDKELEELERGPYDADDFDHGSFQENNLLASYSRQEDSYYTPACHHAASLAFTPPVRMTEIGQFDDADE